MLQTKFGRLIKTIAYDAIDKTHITLTN